MMWTTLLAVLLAALFGGLSAVHFYWAVGGGRGFLSAVPEVEGKLLFRPGPGACTAVALALALAALLCLAQGGFLVWFRSRLPQSRAMVFSYPGDLAGTVRCGRISVSAGV